MIFGWFDRNIRGNRFMATKAYELENLVKDRLKEKGRDIPLDMIDASTRDVIASYQTAGIYLMIGFNPEQDPEIAGKLPEFLNDEGYNALPVRSSDIKNLPLYDLFNKFFGSQKQCPRVLQKEPSDQGLIELRQKYNLETPQDWAPKFSTTVKEIYSQDKKLFAELISDILLPFYALSSGRQKRYLKDIKEVVDYDHPGILEVCASAFDVLRGLKK